MRPRTLDVARLRYLYDECKLSIPEIATLLHRCPATIHENLHRYNIPTRTRSQGNSIAAKKIWRNPAYISAMQHAFMKYSVTKPQKMLYQIIKQLFPDAILNMFIHTAASHRIIDIAIPSRKIALEFDCEYWHNKENDNKRDDELEGLGWKTIRIGYNGLDKIKSVSPSTQEGLLILTQYEVVFG